MADIKRSTAKKRESILTAAAQAFQEEGYENTSMDRIADRAKASKRTVYNHFGGKEVLFQEVVKRFMEELSSLKKIPYDPGKSLEEQLNAFAEAKLSVLKNPSWLGMMKVALGVFIRDPNLAQETMCRAQAGENSLVLWIRAAVEDGRLKVPDPGLAAEIFWAMVGGGLFWPQVFGNPMDPEVQKRLQAEFIQTFLNRFGAGV